MGFFKFLTQWAGLSFGIHWDSHPPQYPILNPSIVEPSSLATQFCNTPANRSCWIKSPLGDFDLYTNYEERWPQGVTREVCFPLVEGVPRELTETVLAERYVHHDRAGWV
jgi:hypothetical protein